MVAPPPRNESSPAIIWARDGDHEKAMEHAARLLEDNDHDGAPNKVWTMPSYSSSIEAIITVTAPATIERTKKRTYVVHSANDKMMEYVKLYDKIKVAFDEGKLSYKRTVRYHRME